MLEHEPVVKLNLFDLLLLLAKWRILFFVNCSAVIIISVIMALSLPKWYTATTVILPPSGGGGVPSFLSKNLVGVASTFGLEVPTDDIYYTILTSRTLKDRIIDKYHLREVYEMPDDVYPEDVVIAFEGHYTVGTRVDLAVFVEVEDQQPERAAAIANDCVAELDRIFRDITSEAARKKRVYIERRLRQVEDSLNTLEDSLRNFQEITGAISIPEQIVAMMSASADVKARLIYSEVQLDVLRSNLGEDHPMVAQLRSTSRELKSQYQDLLQGKGEGMFLAVDKLPALGKQYAELFRQLEIQRRLLEFIYPQYESARIQEEKETANVRILDKAVVSEKKTRPLRKQIVVLATGGAFIITLMLVLFLEYWRKLPERNEEDWSKVQQLKKLFKRG